MLLGEIEQFSTECRKPSVTTEKDHVLNQACEQALEYIPEVCVKGMVLQENSD